MLGAMSFSASERRRLSELMLRLGPDAPTLCEGWQVRDLASHLWVRENQPLAAAGMFVPALAQRLDQAMDSATQRDFQELVGAWAQGPSPRSPFKLIDAQANLTEHFIHHEDVRRANGLVQSRDLSLVVQGSLYRSLKMLAPRLLGKSKQPVVLHPGGFDRIVCADKRQVARQGDAVVTVTGAVGELLLWVYGRDVVELDFSGDVGQVTRSGM